MTESMEPRAWKWEHWLINVRWQNPCQKGSSATPLLSGLQLHLACWLGASMLSWVDRRKTQNKLIAGNMLVFNQLLPLKKVTNRWLLQGPYKNIKFNAWSLKKHFMLLYFRRWLLCFMLLVVFLDIIYLHCFLDRPFGAISEYKITKMMASLCSL